jgi:2-keto-3-deoxy-L-rhamnonate aldolase RhmA
MTIEHGTFVEICSPHVVHVLGTNGLDFALIDAKHAHSAGAPSTS